MKKILTLGVALSLVGISTKLSAQDIHFSQYYMAPTQLNPAMTGISQCNHRVTVNYRNQWAAVLRDKAFQTYSASYDTKIPVGRYDYFGVGGTLWGDQAGSLNWHSRQAHVSGSYVKKMGGYRRKAHYLAAGVDAAFAQRGIDLTLAQFGNQANAGVFNSGLPSGETNLLAGRDNFFYGDVAAGLLFYSVYDDNANSYIGAAYSHINRANQSFTDDKFIPLFSKFTFHAGGEIPLGSSSMSLMPNLVVFSQGKSFQTNFGTSLRFMLGSSRRSTEFLQFGLWTRLSNRVNPDGTGNGGGILMDAIVPTIRFDYQNFGIGFSYDVNTSSLKTASNYNGGFEFALQYKICGNERRGVFCPKF
jgi:type IX secretion system PorP/SprF family membrane protein